MLVTFVIKIFSIALFSVSLFYLCLREFFRIVCLVGSA